MWSRRRFALGYLLAALLVLTALFGCRAFEPETVIVNNAPETFIIGAPSEEAGGYFHFHVYWYGTDADGRVDRYVWALTDSTVQDEETIEDEEDARFNPAENITTLDIGHWTTETDTIFDFQINQGSVTSIDKTFHIVAVDDRGDYDRTPARLYFLSNALGNPWLTFYSSRDHSPETVFADSDTIGFGNAFTLSWEGDTPNIRSYSSEILAERDTVPPYDDGLFGYKFRLPTDVDCDESNEDCWNPRYFDDSVNDSLSFFGSVVGLDFENGSEGYTGADVYRRRLASGVHKLMVNTIDVAGVEVQNERRNLDFVINYDPDTRLLRGQTDPFNPSDTQVYPYYQVYRPDGSIDRFALAEGDTVPHRGYVVFKAIGWDDARDQRAGVNGFEGYDVLFKGQFDAVGLYRATNPYRFSTLYSLFDPQDREDSGNPVNFDWLGEGGSADTLGFVVGPFEYDFNMASVDEHLRVDGTPDYFHFYGNFAPCVQCVETIANEEPSEFVGDACYDGACAAKVDTLFASQVPMVPAGHPDWKWMGAPTPGAIAVNPRSGAVLMEVPDPLVGDLMRFDGFFSEYELYLHGTERDIERLFDPETGEGDPRDRIMSWRYEIRSDADAVSNAVADGGGIDDITNSTFEFSRDLGGAERQPVVIDDAGVWRLRIKVFVPSALALGGVQAYRDYLEGQDELMGTDWADKLFELTTLQLGPTTAWTQARDASNCAVRPDRGVYVYYQFLRVPSFHGESCTTDYSGSRGELALDSFASVSEIFEKRYVIKMVSLISGEIYPPDPE